VSFYPDKSKDSGLRAWLKKRFPERMIYIRTGGESRTIEISTGRQVAFVCVVMCALSWMAYSTGMQYAHETILANKRAQVVAANNARDSVLAEVASYRTKVNELTAELELNQKNSVASAKRRVVLLDEIKTLGKRLETEKLVKSTRSKLQQQHDDLQNQLGALDLQSAKDKRQHAQLSYELAEIGKRLQYITEQSSPDRDTIELHEAVLQRDFAITERDALLAENKKLSERLLEIQNAQKQIFDQVSALANDGVSQIEETLKKAGLNVDELLRKHESSSRGGPYIPVSFPNLGREDLNDDLKSVSADIERWDRLANLMDVLPLGYPVKKPRVTSGYGYRRDPFKGTLALHSGIDFRGQKGDLAYATAPGTVISAKRRGNYGITVDVDHGMGFVTRYAHLDKALVKAGDEVQIGSKVGLVGNTGRSTGRHLHYEIRYNGKPRNPKSMVRVKRYVQEKR